MAPDQTPPGSDEGLIELAKKWAHIQVAEDPYCDDPEATLYGRLATSLLRVTEERDEWKARTAWWFDKNETAEASLSALRGEVGKTGDELRSWSCELMNNGHREIIWRVPFDIAHQLEASLLSTLEGNDSIVSRVSLPAHVSEEETATDAPHSTGWLPIETMPRDGTWFLACCREKTRLVHYADKHDRLPISGNPGEMWPSLPTHWMPLPARPAEHRDAVAVGPSPTCARNETRDEPLQTPHHLKGEEP